MKTQQTGKPILDALLNASELFADKPEPAQGKAQHSPLPELIVQGKVDGALVDQNGIYVSPSQVMGVLRKVAGQRDRAVNHADKLAEALREIFKQCACVHKYWGEGCNQREADAAVTQASEALAAWEKAKA